MKKMTKSKRGLMALLLALLMAVSGVLPVFADEPYENGDYNVYENGNGNGELRGALLEDGEFEVTTPGYFHLNPMIKQGAAPLEMTVTVNNGRISEITIDNAPTVLNATAAADRSSVIRNGPIDISAQNTHRANSPWAQLATPDWGEDEDQTWWYASFIGLDSAEAAEAVEIPRGNFGQAATAALAAEADEQNYGALSIRNGIVRVLTYPAMGLEFPRPSEVLGGSGTDFDPFEISTPDDLVHVATQVNTGDRATYADAFYRLTQDIDLYGIDWVPIGNSPNTRFAGNIDGAGHAIRNLTIGTAENPNETINRAGLIGTPGPNGVAGRYLTIENLRMENTSIFLRGSGERHAGAIIGASGSTGGEASAIINNVSVDGGTISVHALNGRVFAGGIAGWISHNTAALGRTVITNSWTNIEVIAQTESGAASAGGIAGYIGHNHSAQAIALAANLASFGNVTASGVGTGTGTGKAGGEEEPAGTLTPFGNSVAGGLFGTYQGVVYNSFAVGNVSGSSHNAGLLIGRLARGAAYRLYYNTDATLSRALAVVPSTSAYPHFADVGTVTGTSDYAAIVGRPLNQMQGNAAFQSLLAGNATVEGVEAMWAAVDNMPFSPWSTREGIAAAQQLTPERIAQRNVEFLPRVAGFDWALMFNAPAGTWTNPPAQPALGQWVVRFDVGPDATPAITTISNGLYGFPRNIAVPTQVPIRAGFEFAGWNPALPAAISASTTFRAVWTPVPFSLSQSEITINNSNLSVTVRGAGLVEGDIEVTVLSATHEGLTDAVRWHIEQDTGDIRFYIPERIALGGAGEFFEVEIARVMEVGRLARTLRVNVNVVAQPANVHALATDEVTIDDGNLTATVGVTGEQPTGNVSFGRIGLPDAVGVTWDAEEGEIAITGARPAHNEAPITGVYVITTTRGTGANLASVPLTVNVNLTPLAGPDPDPDPDPCPDPSPDPIIRRIVVSRPAAAIPDDGADGEVTDPAVPLFGVSSFAAFINGHPDGTFRGGDNMTREQFVNILHKVQNPDGLPVADTNNPSFTDVAPGRWSYDAVEWAVAAGVVDAGGAFRPADPITRAEMAVMLVRADGLTETTENIFSDIDGHPAYDDILRAVNAGLFRGFPGGTFSPDGTASRNEAAAAMIRYLLGGTPTDDMLQGVNMPLTDVARTHWAFPYIALATRGFTALP